MEVKNLLVKAIGLPQCLVVGVIELYQKTLSPDHGLLARFKPYGYCRFHPSCSEYAILAIRKFGLWRGAIKAAVRLARCNPWSTGGVDLP